MTVLRVLALRGRCEFQRSRSRRKDVALKDVACSRISVPAFCMRLYVGQHGLLSDGCAIMVSFHSCCVMCTSKGLGFVCSY